MNLNSLYNLLTESVSNEDQLILTITNLQRKVRAAYTKAYKLHLNADMFPPAVYKEKLRNAFQRTVVLKNELLDFLESNKHDILMSAKAVRKIKEFKDRNPHVFSNK